jgi:hypothetical protein
MKKLTTSPPWRQVCRLAIMCFSRQTLERFASERRYERNLKWQR